LRSCLDLTSPRPCLLAVLLGGLSGLLGFAAQGCGVWASTDCTERASCSEGVGSPDDVANRESDGGSGAGQDTGARAQDAGGPGAVDAWLAGDAASDRDAATPPDVVSADAATRDVANGDATTMDASGEDVTGDASATSPDASNDASPDASNDASPDASNDASNDADACGALACAPPVPSGWQGLVALAEVPAGSALPACPSGSVDLLDANLGLSAPAATCGCTCHASGQVCSATGAFHGDQACAASTCATVTVSSSNGCVSVPSNGCGSGGSFNLASTPAPSGGSCAPQVTTTVPPASWGTSARLCSYVAAPSDAGGCASDRCVAMPPSPYRSTPCVYSTADPPPSACPSGYDAANPVVVYSASSDTRGCGACTCSAPTGGGCAGTVGLFGGTGCSGASGSASYTVGTSCQAYSGLSPVPGSLEAHFAVTAGSCSVVAAPQPAGGVTPETPTTVCCL
jgi:hypothetical protein